jgi:hypothetical protein
MRQILLVEHGSTGVMFTWIAKFVLQLN